MSRKRSWQDRVFLACLSVMISGRLLAAQSANDIIVKINQAESDREERLAGYNVTERYEVYEPGDDRAVGGAVFEVSYIRGRGKTYSEKSLFSRKRFVKRALERTVRGEERASHPESRKNILVTSDNYKMALVDQGKEPQPSYICSVNRPARKTRVVAIKPILSGPELIDGFLWVDSENYHIVRIEGRFSDSPSIWIGRPVFERDYVDLNGFAVATSSCSVSQSWFSHERLQITYSDYTFLH
jgi:hypothetical protein